MSSNVDDIEVIDLDDSCIELVRDSGSAATTNYGGDSTSHFELSSNSSSLTNISQKPDKETNIKKLNESIPKSFTSSCSTTSFNTAISSSLSSLSSYSSIKTLNVSSSTSTVANNKNNNKNSQFLPVPPFTYYRCIKFDAQCEVELLVRKWYNQGNNNDGSYHVNDQQLGKCLFVSYVF